MLQEMHQKAVELEQKKAYEKDRENVKAQMISEALNTKDDKERSQLQLTLKLANFSDIIRDTGKKNGLDLSNMKDKEVVSTYTKDDPIAQTQFTDYVNGKITGIDV
jgi:hypothetical protein